MLNSILNNSNNLFNKKPLTIKIIFILLMLEIIIWSGVIIYQLTNILNPYNSLSVLFFGGIFILIILLSIITILFINKLNSIGWHLAFITAFLSHIFSIYIIGLNFPIFIFIIIISISIVILLYRPSARRYLNLKVENKIIKRSNLKKIKNGVLITCIIIGFIIIATGILLIDVPFKETSHSNAGYFDFNSSNNIISVDKGYVIHHNETDKWYHITNSFNISENSGYAIFILDELLDSTDLMEFEGLIRQEDCEKLIENENISDVDLIEVRNGEKEITGNFEFRLLFDVSDAIDYITNETQLVQGGDDRISFYFRYTILFYNIYMPMPYYIIGTVTIICSWVCWKKLPID